MTVPHRASSIAPKRAFFALSDFIVDSRSSHMKYRDAPATASVVLAAASSEGCTAISDGGSANINQPRPASTEENPSTSRRNERSASGSLL